MSRLNRNLALAAAVLLAASIFTYWNSVSRAERFERGQAFLPNLNPDEIAGIDIEQGEQSVTLRRQGDHYVVEEAQGYVAKNEAVNRLVRDLLELSLEKEVGTGERLAAELEIEPPGDDTVEVALHNAAEQEMVRLRIGKGLEGGSGRYIQRRDGEGGPIYLTSRGVFVDAEPGSYLEKQIVEVESEDIARIEGPDYVLERPEEGGDLELRDVPRGHRPKSAQLNRVENALFSLLFDEVFVADDPEVVNLEFAPALTVELADQSGYRVLTAVEGERTFLRISGHHAVERIAIERDESDEELQEKADVLARVDEIQEFNDFHASWVYELPSSTAERFELRKADLTEPEA